MLEPATSIRNLLFAQWAATDPAKDAFREPDATTPPSPPVETSGGNQIVYFTNRYWLAPPQRIHKHQVSVRPGPESARLLKIGSAPKYVVEAKMALHLWAVAGLGEAFDTVQARMRNMMDEAARIIRVNATLATDLQFVSLEPGWVPADELEDRLVLHRISTVTGVYFQG